jgi:hypothetical protein
MSDPIAAGLARRRELEEQRAWRFPPLPTPLPPDLPIGFLGARMWAGLVEDRRPLTDDEQRRLSRYCHAVNSNSPTEELRAAADLSLPPSSRGGAVIRPKRY